MASSQKKIFAKKSAAPFSSPGSPPAMTTSPSSPEFVYSNYLVFLEDPKSIAPFKVLPGNKIQNLKTKNQIDASFLNNSRRKRQYDIAFTTLFEFPTRIFAKCQSTVPITMLHDITSALNNQFSLLIKCKVPLEDAYEQMMKDNNRKVVAGINYETGEAKKPTKAPPDTASSYSDKSSNSSEAEDEAESCDEVQVSNFMKNRNRTKVSASP